MFQVLAKLEDISTQLENLQNSLSQNINILAYKHNHNTRMEQRIESIDETMIRNTLVIPPPTLKTKIPRPKLVETTIEKPSDDDRIEEQINEIIQESYLR